MPEKGIVWSIRHRPPMTVSMITAILLLMMSFKETIIDTLPVANADKLAILGAWYVWILRVISAFFAILSIAVGVKDDSYKQ